MAVGIAAIAALAGCSQVASRNGTTSAPEGVDGTTAATAEPSKTSRVHDQEIIAEYNDQLVTCYKDHGVTVTVVGDHWELDKGGDTAQVFQIMQDCTDELGPPSLRPADEADARHMYELVLRQARCLSNLGFDVSDPPSEDSWVDTFLAEDPPWTPYDARTMSDAALVSCPDPQLGDLVQFETSPPS